MAAKNLGELLVLKNLITIQQLEKARKEQRNHGNRLATTIVKMGFVNSAKLSEFLASQYQVPSIDLSTFEIDPEALKSITREVCEKHICIPISKAGNTLVVAMADPSAVHARDDLMLLTRCKIEVVVAPEHEILATIDKQFSQKTNYDDVLSELEQQTVGPGDDFHIEEEATDNTNDVPIIRFVNLMLTEAIKIRASDIHIEPYEKRIRIRFRIDGVLYEKIQPPPAVASSLASRLKIMSKLDISERRRPQDGRLKIQMRGISAREVDFRVSVLPTRYGEKIVLRLLDRSSLQLDLGHLGFEADEVDAFREAILAPYGMVLITGPTGSGKTTTIYSALSTLNQPDINISTAEDPVEFSLDGINQVQMNPEIDLTFATALRSFLRQDPDVIMVGEIRDYETADIAFKAALTGHLVVSTLHTNDAPSTVNRFLNMGFEPFIVTSAVNTILAQRLVRKICEKCKVAHKVEAAALIDLGVKEEDIPEFAPARGAGCEACQGIGYKGRIAIYELMTLKDETRRAIFQNVSPMELKQLSIQAGMRTLRQSALLKFKKGLTTLEEVVENTPKDGV